MLSIRLINDLLRLIRPGQDLEEVGLESLNEVLVETIAFVMQREKKA